MNEEAQGEVAAQFAIELHNQLHGATFPRCRSMKDLASQTRMVLGALELTDQATKESWEAVLMEALDEAFQMGEGKAHEPTEEEMEHLEAAIAQQDIDAVPPENIRKVLHQIRAFGAKLDLESALRAHLGMHWCVQQGFLRPGRDYYMVVRSCLLCGKHEYTWPPLDETVDRSFFRKFCQIHSTCNGLHYADEELFNDD